MSLADSLLKWAQSGGSGELEFPRDARVTTAAEAVAVCDALGAYDPRSDGGDLILSPLHRLVGLFQDAEGASIQTLRRSGLPQLRRILQSWMETVSSKSTEERTPLAASDYMFLAKILALYGEKEDVALIAELARLPVVRDEYLWEVVFRTALADESLATTLCDKLCDPIPRGFLGVAYLDLANALARDGKIGVHPFNSDEGTARLKEMIGDTKPEHSSHAVSAIAAAPFLMPYAREALFTAADHHNDPLVRVESAWARERAGDLAGRALLTAFCLDPRYAQRAMMYLEELGLIEAIPVSSRTPDFLAQAEMCDWLGHPMEFGEPPDRISMFDSRELFWPPTNDRRVMWLLKYEYDKRGEREETVGIGLVGSITFAMFEDCTPDMSPEDIFGVHCCWELETNTTLGSPVCGAHLQGAPSWPSTTRASSWSRLSARRG